MRILISVLLSVNILSCTSFSQKQKCKNREVASSLCSDQFSSISSKNDSIKGKEKSKLEMIEGFFNAIPAKDRDMLKQKHKKPDPEITKILNKYINTTNIKFPSLLASYSFESDFNLFLFNKETGVIKVINSKGNEIASHNTWSEFKSLYEEGSYFPFILDASQPSLIIFGEGAGAKYSSGVNVENTLLRNGGHVQLASRFQGGTSRPSLDGLFGGGLVNTDTATPNIEFNSRGVNQSPDGQLSPGLQEALNSSVLSFFVNP